ESVGVGDHDDFVTYRAVKIAWYEAGADSLYLVRSGLAAAEHRSLGFHGAGQHLGQVPLQEAGSSGEGTCRPGTDDQRVDAPFHLFENFLSGGFVVIVRIGGIIELGRHERTGSMGHEIVGAADGALHTLSVRGASYL